MVDADDVKAAARRAHALEPPIKAAGSHVIPVVDRVAPELAVPAEAIGRTTGHDARTAGAGELEVFRMRPDVGGIERGVARQIADDADAAVVGVFAQPLPLVVEAVLQEAVEADVGFEQGAVTLDRGGLVRTDVGGPFGPRAAAEVGLHGHKERVFREPRGLLLHIFIKIRGHGLQKARERAAQHGQAGLIEEGIVDVRGVLTPALPVQLLLRQPTGGDELIRVDEVGIARKRGKRLIGRIAIARRTDREDLPIGLPGFFEKVDKVISGLAEVAHAVWRGERGNVQQNAAASVHHKKSLAILRCSGRSRARKG